MSWRRDLVLESHPKGWRCGGSKQQSLGRIAITLTTATLSHIVIVFQAIAKLSLQSAAGSVSHLPQYEVSCHSG